MCHYYPENPNEVRVGGITCSLYEGDSSFHNWRNGLPIDDNEARKAIIYRRSKGDTSKFDELLIDDLGEVFDDPYPDETYTTWRNRMKNYGKSIRKPSRFDDII